MRPPFRPILWETLFLECATVPGDIASLLSAGNGVLPHVRYIVIYTTTGDVVDFDPISDFGTAVSLIIGALPRNCLLGVTIQPTISMSTILSILQCQQSLQMLRTRKIKSSESSSLNLSLASHGSWVAPTLTNIRTLRIPIPVDDDNAYKTSAFLLKNTPRLWSLCLIGESPVPPLLDPFGGPYAVGAAIPTLQLEMLQLLWLNLQAYPAQLFSYINFSNLRVLCISQCRSIGAFLSALVTVVPRATALRGLEI